LIFYSALACANDRGCEGAAAPPRRRWLPWAGALIFYLARVPAGMIALQLPDVLREPVG
jgi:hypothetical protein